MINSDELVVMVVVVWVVVVVVVGVGEGVVVVAVLKYVRCCTRLPVTGNRVLTSLSLLSSALGKALLW